MKKIILFLGLCILLSSFVSATPKYWVGGTGSWSNVSHWANISGGVGGGPLPTSADNCIFDILSNTVSYSVTIDTTANCLDFNWTNPLTGSPTLAGTSALNIYGSMNLVSGMTRTHSGQVSFKSTSVGKTLNFNGVATSYLVFDGIGGGWTALDTISISGGISLTNGALDLSNRIISCANFVSDQTTARTINLNNTILTISGWNVRTNNLNLITTNSTINLGSSFGSASETLGASYNIVNYTAVDSDFTFTGPNNFTTLLINGPASTTKSFILASNQIVTGTLNISGNSATNRLLVKSSIFGTQRTISASNVVAANADFQDVAFNQSINLSSGSPIGDCGGNSNITFTPAVNLYWAVNTGSWSTASKWFLGTNGSGGAGRVPLCQDTALFDNASFTTASQTVTQDTLRIGSVNWTGVTNNPTFTTSTVASVFGSLILSPNMTLTASTQTYTFGGRGNYYLDSANQTWTKNLEINNINGNMTLLNNIYIPTIGYIFKIISGNFDANDYNITAGNIHSSQLNTRSIKMGNGFWNVLTQTGWTFNTITGLTLTPENSTIYLNATHTADRSYNFGGIIYNNLWINNNDASFYTIITGSNTFNIFKVDNNRKVQFTAGTTQRIASWNASGNASSYVTIASTSGTNAILNFTGTGVVSSDYLNISDITVNPTNTWYAGTHSITASDAPNWIFGSPIYLSLVTPLNTTYTTTATPTFIGTISDIGGNTANISLILNSANGGTLTGVTTTGNFNITSSTLLTCTLYSWYFSAATNVSTFSTAVNSLFIYPTVGSCIPIKTCQFGSNSIGLSTITGCS